MGTDSDRSAAAFYRSIAASSKPPERSANFLHVLHAWNRSRFLLP